jgi:hypothetical protein
MQQWTDSDTDLGRAARKVVYTLRHVIATQALDDALALRHARGLILQPLTGVSTAEAYDALNEALRSAYRLSTWQGDPRAEKVIPEEDFRGHLSRVLQKLDDMRPWPAPLFRSLDPTVTWGSYVNPREVGAITLGVADIEKRIHVDLVPMKRLASDGSVGEGQVRVAILELRSGQEVALVGRWWSDAPGATAVLTLDRGVPAEEVMSELTSGDHFEPGEFEVMR